MARRTGLSKRHAERRRFLMNANRRDRVRRDPEAGFIGRVGKQQMTPDYLRMETLARQSAESHFV